MKFKDLNGRVFTLSLVGYGDKPTNKSDLHIDARKLLKERYPLTEILEEVSVNILPGRVVYLDFFIPQHKICIEVNGRQHFEFSSFYHQTQANFLQSKKRDREKRAWLELNNIEIIELNYNESREQWRNKIFNGD